MVKVKIWKAEFDHGNYIMSVGIREFNNLVEVIGREASKETFVSVKLKILEIEE